MTRVSSLLFAISLIAPVLSFSIVGHSSVTLRRNQQQRIHPTVKSLPTTKTQLDAFLVELEGATTGLDELFRTQPFLSAFVACSVKASVADFWAQTSSKVTASSQQNAAEVQRQVDATMTLLGGNINLSRNLAFLLYGGLYQGMFLQFLYLVVYPSLYSGSPFQIPLSIVSDIFVFGPFVTLPLAYIIQSIMASITTETSLEEENDQEFSIFLKERVQQALEKYKSHILTQDLLTKYWMVWAPAQTINWCFVPEHWRVFFVAFVSFFWVYLLSLISSQQSNEALPTSAKTAIPTHLRFPPLANHSSFT